MKRLMLALVAVVLMQGGAWAAAPATVAATVPDPSANPVLASIQKAGAKLFFLGSRYGMNGWFLVKDGQVQIAYASPDNKSALVGAMFGENGENVTAIQVAALVQNNKEVADLIASAQKEQAAMAQVGSPAAAAPVSSGAGPSVPLSPGERLIRDLGGASSVVVGNAATPEILMVMDPYCPHCRATWSTLQDSVVKGKVHIRMIPIASVDPDSERASARLLSAANPLDAWQKYVDGDFSQLAGTASEQSLAAVRANHVVIDSWKIQKTPYLVYRGKDGKVKIVQGELEKLSVVLADLGV